MQAYSNFHNYSFRNSVLAMIQCAERGIAVGPIACFNRWKELGRHVMKGQKAITLCMPMTVTRKETAEDGTETKTPFKVFAYKNNWFVLTQTDGEAYEAPAIPAWDRQRALTALEVTEIPFMLSNGNVQGFAKDRSVAINPVAQMPHKTLFHELAHVVLGHTEKSELNDTETLPKDAREVEAESVALILCESLSLPGAEFCLGYIQNWLQGESISDHSASRIFEAADRILKAGKESA